MATWTVTMKVLDLTARTLRVTGVRTEVDDVRTYTITTRWDDALTRAQNGVLFRDALWGLYQAELASEADLATFLGTAQADLAAALTALEV